METSGRSTMYREAGLPDLRWNHSSFVELVAADETAYLVATNGVIRRGLQLVSVGIDAIDDNQVEGAEAMRIVLTNALIMLMTEIKALRIGHLGSARALRGLHLRHIARDTQLGTLLELRKHFTIGGLP